MDASSIKDTHTQHQVGVDADDKKHVTEDGVAVDVSEAHEAIAYSAASLKVDYEWSKKDVKITMANDPLKDSKPVYLINYRLVHTPNLVFKRCSDDQVIGTGTNKAVSISPTYTVNGKEGTIQAAKRLRTQYTHESHHYPRSNSPSPHVMSWKTEFSGKKWSFVCHDEQDTPIAKFHSNTFYLRKVGLFDFYDQCEGNEELKEELLVVGSTLYNQMVIRINNPLNLLGMFPNPTPHKVSPEASSSSTPEPAA